MLDNRKRPREDDDFRGRREFGGKGKGRFAPRFSKGGGKGSKKANYQIAPVDRQATCPTLLRVWVREEGFADIPSLEGGNVPEGEEIRLYYWEDTTLQELTLLLHEKVPMVGDPKWVMTMTAATKMGTGKYRVKDVAFTKARGSARENDNLPLGRTGLKDGDLLLVWLQREQDYTDPRIQRALQASERQKTAIDALQTERGKKPEPERRTAEQPQPEPTPAVAKEEKAGAPERSERACTSDDDDTMSGGEEEEDEAEQPVNSSMVVKIEAGAEQEASAAVKSEKPPEKGEEGQKGEASAAPASGEKEKLMEEDHPGEKGPDIASEPVVVKKEPQSGDSDTASSSEEEEEPDQPSKE